jgi:hypothetical protein
MQLVLVPVDVLLQADVPLRQLENKKKVDERWNTKAVVGGTESSQVCMGSIRNDNK